jgi:hypothetical protein
VKRPVAGVLFTLGVALGTGTAVAQPQAPSSTPQTSRWTIAGGLSWAGSYPIGELDADLLQNAPGVPPPALRLFSTTSTFDSTPGLEGRFGFAITPRVTLEVGGLYSKPTLTVEISNDTEGEATTFEGETISQYVIDVSVVYELPFVRRTARVRPYVIGGGSYLRQLHEEDTLVETGQLYHFGGGARLFFRGAATGHPVGIRGDIQATIRRDGIEFEEKRRVLPTASLLIFFGF